MKLLFSLLFFIIVIVIAIAVAVGWVFNIQHLVHIVGPIVMSGENIVRLVGVVVVPVGSFMGWFF